MRRITISLPEELAVLAAREARHRGASVSALVRDALSARLGVGDETVPKLPFEALGRSGRRHTARDAEKILAREWVHGRRTGRR